MLYRLKILDLEWIDETLGSAVIEFWQLWELSVMQDRPKRPTLYRNWQTLAEELLDRRNRLRELSYNERA